MTKLTELEAKVLKAMWAESASNGHDFGLMQLVQIPGLSRKALGGVVTNLVTKGIVTVWGDVTTNQGTKDQDTWTQYTLDGGAEYFTELGLEVPYKAKEAN